MAEDYNLIVYGPINATSRYSKLRIYQACLSRIFGKLAQNSDEWVTCNIFGNDVIVHKKLPK